MSEQKLADEPIERDYWTGRPLPTPTPEERARDEALEEAALIAEEHQALVAALRIRQRKPLNPPPPPQSEPLLDTVKPGDRFVKRHPDGTTEHFEAVPGEGIVPQQVGHYAPTPDRPASPARPCPDKFPHVEHDWIVDRGTFRCPGRER